MAGGWMSEFATVRWHLQQRNGLVQCWLRLSLCREISAHVQMSSELRPFSAATLRLWPPLAFTPRGGGH